METSNLDPTVSSSAQDICAFQHLVHKTELQTEIQKQSWWQKQADRKTKQGQNPLTALNSVEPHFRCYLEK